MQTNPESPLTLELQHKVEPWAAVIHNGPPSVTRNRACQSVRSYNIKLGHAAYYRPANELIPEALPLVPPSLAFFTTGSVDNTPSTGRPANPTPTGSVDNTQAASSSSTANATPAAAIPAAPQRTATQKAEYKGKNKLSASKQPPADRQPNNLNLEKFSVPKSEWEPPVVQAWASALSSVDHAETNAVQHADRNLLRGYLFPDPFLFTKGEGSNKGRSSIYIVGWLAIRAKWMEWVIDNQDDVKKYPRPQEWRDALADVAGKMGLMALLAKNSSRADPAAKTGSATKKPNTQPPAKRRKVADDQKLAVDLSGVKGPIDICWNGEDLVSAAALAQELYIVPDAVAREVVWDLYEHNFRLELLALDRCVVSRGAMSELDGLDRDDKVRQCFPNDSLVNLDVPVEDRGLGAGDWGHRMQWVEALRRVLIAWPQCPEILQTTSAVQHLSTGHIVSDEKRVCGVERVAYPFYCQTFFNYFGRAPSIPHILPFGNLSC
ncbi:hypothetical protein CVT26_008735 [Gymnopilus dilepis]|nr:hypothetical protein CVT26_008735 [Gymnopilus dilepis]